jgi:hypothetical protein
LDPVEEEKKNEVLAKSEKYRETTGDRFLETILFSFRYNSKV